MADFIRRMCCVVDIARGAKCDVFGVTNYVVRSSLKTSDVYLSLPDDIPDVFMASSVIQLVPSDRS